MKAVKEGYILKQSVYLKQFRKRWMVLMDDKLVSFSQQINGDNTKQPTEIFDLSVYDKVIRARNGKHYEFQLLSESTKDKRNSMQ